MSVAVPERVEISAGRHVVVARYGDLQASRVLVFDPGSFGIYADGHHVCATLAERGWGAISITRAGMFGSDPLPAGLEPTPRFHLSDLLRVMAALNIERPIVLAGHSMAGARLHLAGCEAAERFRGLALLDAVCPSLMSGITWAAWIGWAKGIGMTGALVAGSTLAGLVETLHPNLLKLEGRARDDKLASVRSSEHLRAAAAEVAATERKLLEEPIEPALHLPTYFATATPVSQGTSKLVELYQTSGTWTARDKFPKDNHLSVITPPSVKQVADRIDELWEAAG